MPRFLIALCCLSNLVTPALNSAASSSPSTAACISAPFHYRRSSIRSSRGAMGGAAPSILDANLRLRAILVGKGYPVAYFEVPNGDHSRETWRLRCPLT